MIHGRFARATMTSAASMAALTGQPSRFLRRVAAEVGPDGVTVRRSGNGAARFVYHDLLLAERLAARAEAAT